MSAVGAVNIRLGAIVSGFLSGMSQASAATTKLSLDVNSKLVDSYKRADQAQKVFKGGIERLGGSMQSIGQNMTMFGTLPALFAAGKAYKDFADIERLEMGLKNYGNTLAEVQELAKRPNIDIQSASKALLGLRAVGVESDLAKRSVTAFANALTLAGGSAADLEPSLYNITQILSTNKVSADEIKEIAGRIPQVRAAIQNAFGTSDSEELKKLGIDAKTFVNGVITELEKLPQVAGGAQNGMDTFADSVKIASATVGGSLDRSLGITTKLAKLGDVIQDAAKWFSGLSAGTQKTITTFAGLAVASGPVIFALGSMVKLAPLIATGFAAINAPLAIGIGLLAGIVVYWDELYTVWNRFAAMASKLQAVMLFVANPGSATSVNEIANFGEYSSKFAQKYDPAKKMLLPGETSTSKKFPFLSGGNGAGLIQPTQAAAAANKDLTAALAATTVEVEELSKAEIALKSIDLASKYYNERDAVKAATEEYKKLVGVVSGLDVEKMQGVANLAFGSRDRLAVGLRGKEEDRSAPQFAISEGQTGLAGRAAEIANFKLPEGVTDKLATEKDRVVQINQDLLGSMQGFYMNVAVGFGEMLGNLAAGTASLSDLPIMIAQTLGQMMKDIGKSFVAMAIATAKIKAFIISNPGLAIAGGIALIAVGQGLQATAQSHMKRPAFAKGGFAYGEMLATVGDNPNARVDPEMIAPYSKVDKSIQQSIMKHGGGGGSSMVVEVVGMIKGEDIELIRTRAARRKNAMG